MRKGDRVRCLGPPLLAGREGIVIVPRSMGEVGVSFGGDVVYWFLPSEIRPMEKGSSNDRSSTGKGTDD